MVQYKCSKCENQFDLSQGGGVPADSRGLPDESKALCGICRPKTQEKPSRMPPTQPKVAYDPKRKSINYKVRDKNPMALAQPYKKQGGKVVDNEKFYEYYGGERAAEPAFNKDPERAAYYKKKYPVSKKKY